jgi:hypothetical protein
MKSADRTSQAGWIAYVRFDETVAIKTADEPKPTRFAEMRPATQKEIAFEVAARAERDAHRARLAAYDARPDVQDARAVRDAIEFMDCGDGLVDRLAPAEWAELRRRLATPETE